MSESTDRLRNLLEDRLDGCCGADLAARIDELDDLRAGAPLDRTADDVRVLSALASDTRYEIARLLQAADEDLCVCEIDPMLDVSHSAVSHALSELTDAGLVARRKEGRWRYYRTTPRCEALLDALDASREGDR